jgi:hypothetical protein
VEDMPLLIEKGPSQAPETGPNDSVGASAGHDVHALGAGVRCTCDECQAPSRDEMWTRWA